MQGIILLAFAAMLWGTTGTSQALAPEGVTPLSVGALRLVVGGITLLILAVARGGFRQRTSWHLVTVLIAAAGIAIYQPAFFGGTEATGVAVGTMIAIGSAPVFAGIIGYIFKNQMPTRQWALATLLAVIGGVILVTADRGELTIRPVGVILSLTAGLCYVVYATAMKDLTVDHPEDEVVAVCMGLGALFLAPLLLVTDLAWAGTLNGLIVVLHLGVLATGLSYALFGRGVKTVPISTAATLVLIEPLTATLLGFAVLGEVLNGQHIVGILLIFSGLGVLAFQRR